MYYIFKIFILLLHNLAMSDDELTRRKGRPAPPARYGRDSNDDDDPGVTFFLFPNLAFS